MRLRNKEIAVHRIAICGILAALAAVAGYLESLIPVPIPVPGIKLGLANVVVLVALYALDGRSALFISVVRIAVVSALFGNLSGFIYSACGGVVSLAMMSIGKRLGVFSVIGVSVLGGVFHNIAQIAVAALVLQSPLLLNYLSVLIIAGIVAGVITGVIAAISLRHLKIIKAAP